jgi:hypothetical protein
VILFVFLSCLVLRTLPYFILFSRLEMRVVTIKNNEETIVLLIDPYCPRFLSIGSFSFLTLFLSSLSSV